MAPASKKLLPAAASPCYAPIPNDGNCEIFVQLHESDFFPLLCKLIWVIVSFRPHRLTKRISLVRTIYEASLPPRCSDFPVHHFGDDYRRAHSSLLVPCASRQNRYADLGARVSKLLIRTANRHSPPVATATPSSRPRYHI